MRNIAIYTKNIPSNVFFTIDFVNM